MPLNCQEIKTFLNLLALKQASFKLATEEALQGGDFTHAKQLKQELETLTHSLHEAILPTQLEQAGALFQENFLGPDALQKTFGFTLEIKNIPFIPFSKQELKEAKERGDILIYNCTSTPEGKPLTLETMARLSGGNVPIKDKEGNDVYPLYIEQFNPDGSIYTGAWFKNDPLILSATPETGWQIVSPDIITDSTSKNYINQTDFLINHIKQSFTGQTFKKGSIEARAEEEWIKQKPIIQKLITENKTKEASEALSCLQVSSLFREPLGNTVFRYLVALKAINKRLFSDSRYSWSKTVVSDGFLAGFGYADRRGARVVRGDPGDGWANEGVVSSRRKI